MNIKVIFLSIVESIYSLSQPKKDILLSYRKYTKNSIIKDKIVRYTSNKEDSIFISILK